MNRTYLLAALAFLAFISLLAKSYGQGVAFSSSASPITNSMGQPISGVAIGVCTAAATIPPTCGTPVTVYKDAALTAPYTTLSPLLSDGFGNFYFFVSPSASAYCYTTTAPVITGSVCQPFSLPVAPSSSPTFTGLTVNGASALNGAVTGITSLAMNGPLTGVTQFSYARLFKTCTLDGVNYATFASILSDSANCSAAYIPPGTSTSEPSITFTRVLPTYAPGSCALNYGTNTITVNQGVNGFSFHSDAQWSTNTPANACRLIYTGNSTFITVGSTSGDTNGFQLWNVYLDLSGAGNAAIGLDLIRTQDYWINLKGQGNSNVSTTQIGIKFDGTSGGASFSGYGSAWASIQNVNIGIQGNGVSSGAANANTWYFRSPGLNGTNSICVDIEDGSQNEVHIQDCNGATTSFVAKNSSISNIVFERDESVTNNDVFDSSSCNNTVHLMSGITNITDPGACNAVFDPVFGQYFFGTPGGSSGQVEVLNTFTGGGFGGVGTSNNFPFNIFVNKSRYWFYDTSGHYKAITDNQNDIGASGANRPRNAYIANGFSLAGSGLLTGVTGSGNLAGDTGPTFQSIANGKGAQFFNTTTNCSTGASVGANCTTAAISLPVGYSDTNYRVVCMLKSFSTGVPVIVATSNSSNTQFTITTAALTAAAASYGSADCVAFHN